MTEHNFKELTQKIYRLFVVFFSLSLMVMISFFIYLNDPMAFNFTKKNEKLVSINLDVDDDRIENGIHVATGLIEAEGLMTVVNNCTNCHSAKLVTQNRMSADAWNATIAWMQETQNLWDLGENQEIIVHYLVTNYPVETKGRRMALGKIEWYQLEE